MDRKEFIQICGTACLTAFSLLLSGCTKATYFAQSKLVQNNIVIKKTEFLILEKEKNKTRKYVLVKLEKSEFPIIVYRFSEKEYTALLMRCTHKGCELHPQGSYLVCPCHGSEFDNKGVVQNPPAEQNLKIFKTTLDDENIYIQL